MLRLRLSMTDVQPVALQFDFHYPHPIWDYIPCYYQFAEINLGEPSPLDRALVACFRDTKLTLLTRYVIRLAASKGFFPKNKKEMGNEYDGF